MSTLGDSARRPSPEPCADSRFRLFGSPRADGDALQKRSTLRDGSRHRTRRAEEPAVDFCFTGTFRRDRR